MGGNGQAQHTIQVAEGHGPPIHPLLGRLQPFSLDQLAVGLAQVVRCEDGLLQQQFHLEPLLLPADGVWNRSRLGKGHGQKVRASAACGRCALPSNMSKSELCPRQP